MSRTPFPITDLYAWVVIDPSGQNGIVGMVGPNGLPMQAVSSKLELMKRPEVIEIARIVARETKLPVKLQQFTLAGTVLRMDSTAEDFYEIARNVCHEHGMPWTDPRTGETYPPPPNKADKGNWG